ncbi:MAG: DUF4347 domain-containing protein, partial [Cyanobacteria bacterium P01_C01_bin.69]
MTSMLLSQNTQINQFSSQDTTQNTLVVIDSGVANISALVTDATKAQADILLLSAGDDAITQITEALAGYNNLSSLHIVSHGTPGCLHLGNTQLSFETLNQHGDSISSWAASLKGKEILLYGCQVAKGAMGHLFVQQLQQLTGANIAASTDRIGRVGDRTNWFLNTQLGNVQTPIVFSADLQATYAGHFDPVVDFSVNTDVVVEEEGTLFQFIFELSEAPPSGGTKVALQAINPDGSLNRQALNQWNLPPGPTKIEGLAGIPVDISPDVLDFSVFEFTITEQNALLELPVFNDFVPDGPDEYTWQITPISGGTVGVDTANVTIYDTRSQVPSGPPNPPPVETTPVVGVSGDPTIIVEDEGTFATIEFTVDQPVAAGGLNVSIGTEAFRGLADFDVFNPSTSFENLSPVLGFTDNDGIVVKIAEGATSASVTFEVFDDPDL